MDAIGRNSKRRKRPVCEPHGGSEQLFAMFPQVRILPEVIVIGGGKVYWTEMTG